MYLLKRNNDLLGRDFLKGFFDNFPTTHHHLMKTDIKEDETNYYLDIEMPGIAKENVKLTMEDGNLVITATTANEKNEETKNYLHKERYYGSYSRTFYIGDIKKEDITASCENGILHIIVPREVAKEEERKSIDIDWR